MISVIITGCDLTFPDYDDPKPYPAASSDAPAALPIFVVDDEGTSLETVESINPATVLYDIRQPDNAVTGPEGNSITWGEYDNVQGNVTVECVEAGTRLTVELTGLIPNGLYTI